MTPELVVLVGIPASGKSSFYAARFASTHVWVSKDRMRHGSGKEARQRREIAEALAAGRSVAVDNTNLTVSIRAPLLQLAHEHGARPVAWYVHADLDEALLRNASRGGRACVPAGIVRQMARTLEVPMVEEGFEGVFRVMLVGGEFVEAAAPG